jgi:hypothetical protein
LPDTDHILKFFQALKHNLPLCTVTEDFIRQRTKYYRGLIAMAKDFTWTTGDDETLSHSRIIDFGGSAEVHEVTTLLTDEVYG